MFISFIFYLQKHFISSPS